MDGHSRIESLRALLRQGGHGATLVSSSLATAPDLDRSEPVPPRLPSGEVDLSLLPPGSVGVVTGAWSSGKTSFALRWAAAATARGDRAAVVDPSGRIFPPALAPLGVALERLLLLTPEPRRAVWAAEQVLRSEAFAAVVLLDPGPLPTSAVRKLQLGAERASSVVLMVLDVDRTRGGMGAGLVAVRFHAAAVPPDPPPAPSTRSAIASPSHHAEVDLLRHRRGP